MIDLGKLWILCCDNTFADDDRVGIVSFGITIEAYYLKFSVVIGHVYTVYIIHCL
jgi:hypothetical protein